MPTDVQHGNINPPEMVPTITGWLIELSSEFLGEGLATDELDALRIAADFLCLLLTKHVGDICTGLPDRPVLSTRLASNTFWQGALKEQQGASGTVV